MKKSVVIVLSALVVILVAVVAVLAVKYKRTNARFAETKVSEQTVRDQFNAALESIVAIQDSLNAIAPQESHLMNMSRGELGSPVTQTQKERMLGTIADLKNSISASKQRIRDLEKSLKGSQVKVTGLLKIIDNLKKSVADREAMVERLTNRVDSLNVTVASLKTDVARGQEQIATQQQVIEAKRKEIGTIFYIVGTRKELKEKGIITESGGIIGLGKTAQVRGSFREGDFTALDTDLASSIAIHGTEPQVLSAQSRDSYEVRLAGDQQTLYIKNPMEFRKVRYLVIMVKEKS